MRSSDKVLILSQDYELFFGNSGSPERCLLEPTNALLECAVKHSLKITFYVDAGMLMKMRQLASSSRTLSRTLDQVSAQLRNIVSAGHEIGLHIHPHWQETRWTENGWDFSGTRYKLSQFSDSESESLVKDYHRVLADTCGHAPVSYRAGGFCTDSFSAISDCLFDLGVTVDSSVVPGAKLVDREKGFDFSDSPDIPNWRFDTDPEMAAADGRFVEVPISPVNLPVSYYWGRLLSRFTGRIPSGQFGDGSSKTFNRTEAVRRLLGLRRVAEMSIDLPKVYELARVSRNHTRSVVHIMGHPKLLANQSIDLLVKFIRQANISESQTVESFSRRVRTRPLAGQTRRR